MKVLWLTTNSMCLEPVVNSLFSIKEWNLSLAHLRFDTVSPDKFNEAILAAVYRYLPDVVLYIGHADGPYVPSDETFKKIIYNVPYVVQLCCDGACPNWWPSLIKNRGNFTLQVNMDGSPNWPGDLALLMPLDPRPYDPISSQKTIPLGFYGGDGALERREILQKVSDIVTTAPRNETYGTYQSYADFMKKCRVVLNFARSGSGKTWHVKNRVREAGLAGGVLLEQKNPITSLWFKPGIDYLEWETVSDIKRIFKNISESSTFYDQKAARLSQKVRTLYTPLAFWSKVFSKIGVWPECK